MGADAAKRFHHLVVAGVLDEDGGRNVCTAPGIDAGAAVDTTVIEDHHAHRQVVTADRFDLHARKTKGTIAFDCQHGVACLHGRRNGHAHAHTHDPPGPDVQAFAGLVYIDDAPGEIERVGALIHEDRVGSLFDDRPQRPKRPMVIHWHIVVLESRRHPGDVGFHLGADGVDPSGRWCCPVLPHACKQGLHARTDIADYRGRDLDIAVHLLGFDIDLDKLLGLITP